MAKLTGIGLSAGEATRLRPLSLKSDNYQRSKGAVHLLGTRPLLVTVKDLKRQGIREIYMVTRGKENGSQTRRIIGYGENLGLEIKYSYPESEDRDTGSADATMTIMDNYDIGDTALVFPNDNLYDVNLNKAYEFHKANNSILTILTTTVPAQNNFDQRGEFRYGIVNIDKKRRVIGFTEKPKPEKLSEIYGLSLEQINPLVNAGAYILQAEAIRGLGKNELAEMREKRLDFGKDLLPWLVQNGFPVFAFDIDKWGDFGDISGYIETTVRGLNREFKCLGELGEIYDASQIKEVQPKVKNLWIDTETLNFRRKGENQTLEEKIMQGDITLIGNVRIGKYVHIRGCGTVLENSNLDNECEIGECSVIRNSSLGERTRVGSYTKLIETATGVGVRINSSINNPTTCEKMVALGDSVLIGEGSTLKDNTRIWPKVKIPEKSYIEEKTIETED
ncbi:NDP-sugar synthase [Candidatus Pacearchaeota archaeon]|nr:NDP-sugar synthase [Candidatus Pacearchaeota archaeon]